MILAPTLHQHTVDTKALVYKKIARGAIDSDGPDLAAVILAPSVAATIAAKKVFYNLDSRRDHLLSDPPDREEGVWFVHGFVDEGTREEPGREGYSLVKSFYSFSGAGGPEQPAKQDGDHDYYAFPVTHNARSVAPISFGGMSGGVYGRSPCCETKVARCAPRGGSCPVWFFIRCQQLIQSAASNAMGAQAFGYSQLGRLLAVCHTYRPGTIRIINARRVTRSERRPYEED